MKLSLPGLFKNAERAMRSSRDDYACMSAYSLGELIDNLRSLKNGVCTVEEFFSTYVFDAKSEGSFADRVQKKNFECMRDEPEDDENEEAA